MKNLFDFNELSDLSQEESVQISGGGNAKACADSMLSGGMNGAGIGAMFGALGGPGGALIGAGIGSLVGGALVARYYSVCQA
ncbi:Blp family class II bacteriocin [Olivibacter domesticus]|uniref:Uncharacterized protein n=1 Tax=Olivibacter domesticus TaxID=407022 RepID=A0A1H7HJ81_OLID1|nr:Blp family class II bacteriocin [Olivibacter domesticus]SEK49697.1 hypothetical protein SAMN05661044_00382 [Olivibacter domesticus]